MIPARPFVLPRLYAILDAGTLARLGLDLLDTAQHLANAGVELMQYRDKTNTLPAILRNAEALSRRLNGSPCTLILNDHPNLVEPSGFRGVHLGQTDMDPVQARALIGKNKILGLSTHTPQQLQQAASSPVDYLAIGPVFRTGTKPDADPEIGLEGVRAARSLTRKPLVAIGGLSLDRLAAVLDAGANSVAVISALYQPDRPVADTARELLEAVREAEAPAPL